MRRSTALAATIASGVLYGCAFPLLAWHALAWVALVPWLVATRRSSARGAVLLAWVWALSAAYTLNDWFPRAVSVYYLQPAWVGAALFLAVSTFTAAPAFAAFVLCWRRLRPGGAGTPLFAAAAWAGAEWMRSRLFGDPWALAGYSQVPVPALVQVAEVTGIYGTSFVLAAVNAALAGLWLARRERGIRQRVAWRGLATATGVALAVAAYGVLRLRQLEAGPPAAVPIGVVQPNLDLGSQWRPEYYGRNLDAYLRLTQETLGGTPPPALVVWPESALSFFLDDEPLYRAAIARVLGPSGAMLVAGGPRTAGDREPPYHNTAFLVRADGSIAARYDKRRLLPFAEEFPLASVALLRRQFGRVREFTRGAPGPALPTPAGAAGVIICNEALFPEPARARVAEGAAVLLALANDSWVGEPKYAEQAMAMTSVRAVEQRRPLVRASTAGPSALVAPSGRIVARTGAFTAATLTGTIAPRQTRTPYHRIGDLFALACAGAAMATALRRRSTSRAARDPRRHPSRGDEVTPP